MLPVLLHIPHASRHIPAPYDAQFLLSKAQLDVELLRLTDLYTDDLYYLEGAERAVFPVSRFLVDAERFEDDAQEMMAARGMGVIYEKTTQLEPLRPAPSEEMRQELLARYYRPHHQALDRWAERALRSAGRGLFFDCHSYPSQALPYELDHVTAARPEICIGTDSFHTPEIIHDFFIEAFRSNGYNIESNTPFNGTLMPAGSYHQSREIIGLMIEVRKDLYMDELSGLKKPRFDAVRADISRILQDAVRLAEKI